MKDLTNILERSTEIVGGVVLLDEERRLPADDERAEHFPWLVDDIPDHFTVRYEVFGSPRCPSRRTLIIL